jgi:hypothetical protein
MWVQGFTSFQETGGNAYLDGRGSGGTAVQAQAIIIVSRAEPARCNYLRQLFGETMDVFIKMALVRRRRPSAVARRPIVLSSRIRCHRGNPATEPRLAHPGNLRTHRFGSFPRPLSGVHLLPGDGRQCLPG